MQATNPVKSTTETFDGDAAWTYLVKQCDFGPRPPLADSHIQCRDYLLKELAKYTDNAHTSEFSHHWSHSGTDVKMWNIIGDQNWKDAKQRIVLMAHWDTRPFASQESDPEKQKQPILGADDGASGVAVLIELAKELQGKHPDVGIQFVLDDGEDLGPDLDEMFLGAIDYANHLPDPKPDYGILLDMIGNKGVKVAVEPNSYAAAPELARAFYANAADSGLGATFPMSYGDTIEDDHLSLIKAGVPTIDLIDFTYPQWHTLDDTPAHCSPKSLEKIGLALKTWILKSPPFMYPKAKSNSL